VPIIPMYDGRNKMKNLGFLLVDEAAQMI